MVVAGALGNWLGELALGYTSEMRFRLILQLVLTALALRLMWMAVPELGLVLAISCPGRSAAKRNDRDPAQVAKRIFQRLGPGATLAP